MPSFFWCVCVFGGKDFGVRRCNASCFGIFFKYVAELFLEDSGGPEKDLL